MKRWFYELERIKQQDVWNGCGIAAVATACGVTYSRARFEFYPERKEFDDDKSLRVDGNQMLAVVRRLGFEAIASRSFKRFKRPTVLPFKWPSYLGAGVHCVVWDPSQKKTIDPGCDNYTTEEHIDYWRKSGYAAIVLLDRRRESEAA
jgi:hypothetical protein